jgi:hypothetical protein
MIGQPDIDGGHGERHAQRHDYRHAETEEQYLTYTQQKHPFSLRSSAKGRKRAKEQGRFHFGQGGG